MNFFSLNPKELRGNHFSHSIRFPPLHPCNSTHAILSMPSRSSYSALLRLCHSAHPFRSQVITKLDSRFSQQFIVLFCRVRSTSPGSIELGFKSSLSSCDTPSRKFREQHHPRKKHCSHYLARNGARMKIYNQSKAKFGSGLLFAHSLRCLPNRKIRANNEKNNGNDITIKKPNTTECGQIAARTHGRIREIDDDDNSHRKGKKVESYRSNIQKRRCLCKIQNHGPVLICCLNNSRRGNSITDISSQKATIPNLAILDLVGREGRFWLS